MFLRTLVTLGLIALAAARPQLLTFKDGNVGVNFAGYHASAGLGGLLSGNGGAAGGLHAEAGTPYGQRAGAGLGGILGGEGGGRTAGGLYAGATAGGNIGASASLGGGLSAEGGAGGLQAESHVSGLKKSEVIKTVETVPTSYVKTIKTVESQPVEYVKTVETHPVQTEIVKEKTVAHYPVQTEVVKTVEHRPIQTEIVKTIEHHPIVTHKYVKRIHRPHRHRHIVKTFETVPVRTVYKHVETVAPPPPPPHVTYVQKEYVSQVPQYQKFLDFNIFGNLGHSFAGQGHTAVNYESNYTPAKQVVVEKTYTQPKTVEVVKEVAVPSHSAGVEGGFAVGGGYGGRGSTFFDDIFNIPISTLGAVNRLLNNKAGGASGGFYVNKHVSAY